MSGKSRRRQGKHSFQSKKRKDALARATQQQPVSQVKKPVSRPAVSTPSAREPIPRATLRAARNPYITTELQRIGILGGIILTILVVLAFVLP